LSARKLRIKSALPIQQLAPYIVLVLPVKSSDPQTLANRGVNPLAAIQMALSGQLYA
jgi:hypothetical protein